MFIFVNKWFRNMNNRLKQFLSVENISQSAFAERMNIAKASVSHILSGRNKPGFDFLENISRLYPSLNIEWLISGRGRMYKQAHEDSQIFNSQEDISNESGLLFEPETPLQRPVKPVFQERKAISQQNQSRRIEKIIVFYDDNSFEELK